MISVASLAKKHIVLLKFCVVIFKNQGLQLGPEHILGVRQWPVSHSGCICCHLASDSLTLTGGIQNGAFGQWPELSE
ncbi:hypothetical protein R3I94_018079 [Phoxinus phoxinus]